jgi:hypothetical protein
MYQDGSRSLIYTAFDKVASITKGASSLTLNDGIGRQC